MPSTKRRIATYLPEEIDDRFQAFKQEKGISESKALILIMSEYFGVSQQVAYSSDSPLAKQVEELSSLVGELKSELCTKIGEDRISELKSELLGELDSRLKSKPKSELQNQLELLPETVKEPKTEVKPRKPKTEKKPTVPKEVADGVNSLTAAQLEERLGVKKWGVGKMKHQYKGNLTRFTEWSREKDPDGFGWEFRSDSSLFYKVAH